MLKRLLRRLLPTSAPHHAPSDAWWMWLSGVAPAPVAARRRGDRP